MYYRIAALILYSQMDIPSFGRFACEESGWDVRLERTQETLPEGMDIVSGDIAHRKIPGGWLFHSPGQVHTGLLVSDDYTYLRLPLRQPDFVTEEEAWLVRLALECRLSLMGYVSVHAAAVSIDGVAYAFGGPSGMGKSTRAGAFVNALGAQLISGDRPLIHVKSMELYGVPWDGKEQCCKNVHFPLKGFFDIRRSGLNYLRKMSFEQRRRFLMRQCFLPMWDTATAAVQMKNIFRLAGDAPVMRAFCGTSDKDVFELYNEIRRNNILRGETDMKAGKGFILRQIGDEYMLMPVDDNIVRFGGTVLLNEVSAFIWEKLQNSVSREDLLKSILNEYEVDEETANTDLDSFLESLREMGLLLEEQ